MSTPHLYHCLRYTDAHGARAFLTALGFTEVLVVTNPDDPDVVEHAEFRWRDSGGVLFGSSRDQHAGPREGAGSCYLVVDTAGEVDAAHERVLAGGGISVQAPTEMGYGGRGCTVADSEGNQWSVGSYAGA